MPVTRPPLDSQVTEDSCEPREGGRPGGKKSVKVERKKTDGERRGDTINSFIPRNGRAYLYLTSVKRTCVKYAPNQFPPRGCRPRYFPLSVGRSWQLLLARDYFSFPPPTPLSLSSSSSALLLTFDLFSPHRFIHPRISRLRLPVSVSPPPPFSFCFLSSLVSSFSPSKIVAPSRQRSSLYSRPPIRDRINRGKEEPLNAVPSLMLFFIFTLRQTLISGSGFFGRENRVVFIDVLGERNARFDAPPPFFLHPLSILHEGTRVTFFVFSFLCFFFPFSFSFFVKSIRCRSYSSSFLLNGKEIAVRESKKLFFFF